MICKTSRNMDRIPSEILSIILTQYITKLADIGRIERVCKRWNSISRKDRKSVHGSTNAYLPRKFSVRYPNVTHYYGWMESIRYYIPTPKCSLTHFELTGNRNEYGLFFLFISRHYEVRMEHKLDAHLIVSSRIRKRDLTFRDQTISTLNRQDFITYSSIIGAATRAIVECNLYTTSIHVHSLSIIVNDESSPLRVRSLVSLMGNQIKRLIINAPTSLIEDVKKVKAIPSHVEFVVREPVKRTGLRRITDNSDEDV